MSRALLPRLNKVASLNPTGLYLFATPSADPADVQLAWEVYVGNFNPAQDRESTPIPCPTDALTDAYAIMNRAWASKDRTERAELAQAAIDASPMCAEAYYMLAECTATTVQQAMDLYRKGMDAGEKHLELIKPGFLANVLKEGGIWDQPAAHPYMRCRLQFGNCLRETGDFQGALNTYGNILMLNNPMDHLGVKTCMLLTLLKMRNYENAAQMVPMLFQNNAAGVVPCYLFWTDVFLTCKFALDTKSKEALELADVCIGQALALVPEPFPYLLGEKILPTFKPVFITTLEESEAVTYAMDALPSFRAVPGVIDWLISCRKRGAGTDPNFARDPVKAAELKARGNDFFRDGHYDRAVQSYTAAIKLLPDDAEKDRCVLLSNAGAAYYELGFFKQAYSMSLNATKIDPGYWKAHFRCAQALIKMDSKTEAKEHINQLLQSADPNGKEAGEKLSKEVL